MADELPDATQPRYEAPAIHTLGAVDDLTGQDETMSLDDPA